MADPEEVRLIERAREGDNAAFGELLKRYQDLVAGTAYGWLGDAELARDVAQEVFLEAHLKLDQLLEPAAFSGWLRRIVIKQCDRVTRRRSIPTASLETVTETGSSTLNPVYQAEAREAVDQLRFAVEGLPVAERQVIALHYFAEATGPELAAYLELPLSTVKKRLRSARARLKHEGERLMENTMDALRPSRTGDFGKEVSFFIALRAGDRSEVARLLVEDPGLADARQTWERELVLEGVLPFANQATALITAVEQDDLEMLELLLGAGAEVNGCCGCATAESPLWAATLFNRLEHARRLLVAGADPNLASSSGNFPLHLAAMRGYGAHVELLLEYGADASLVDGGPKYPMPFAPADGREAQTVPRTAGNWALANGHRAIADRLRRAEDNSEHTLSQGASEGVCLLDERVLFTGIKALDLFTPLERGGVVRVPFKAGVGMVVLLGELCRRFCNTDDGAAVWTGFSQPPFDLQDWEAEMAELGLKDKVAQRLASFNEPAEVRRAAFTQGVDLAISLRDAGREVLMVVQSTEGFDGDVDASLLRLSASAEKGSITTFVITDFPERDNIWSELQPPYSAQVTLDRRRARQYLFPALDPDASMSSAIENGLVGERHITLATLVREQLAEYMQGDPLFENLDPEDDARAPRLLRYLCQPFFVTEPFTGRQGEWVDRNRMLDELEAIVR